MKDIVYTLYFIGPLFLCAIAGYVSGYINGTSDTKRRHGLNKGKPNKKVVV